MADNDDLPCRDQHAAELYSQVEQLFWEALKYSPEERISWVRHQPRLPDEVQRQLFALLIADEQLEARNTADVDPALAVTISSSTRSMKEGESRSLPCIPNYEIIAEIDRGGMGVVYRALQHRPKRVVAIKMMRMGAFASNSDVQRFLNEANAASALDHTAIVPVYEVGEVSGEPFITMKFIDGETMERLLGENSITITEAVRKLLIVAEAIADAHKQGIIHRDLKPSNILIDRKTGQPWITDFGLAKSLMSATELTAAGDIMGTPGYMAPEQAVGNLNMISRATDVYGLGAILYRILTGRPPIQVPSGDMAKTIELIREHDVISPRERDRRVPGALNTLCIKALETDPERRYADAGEFADDLQRYLDGETLQAKPVGVIRRLHRWARHRPGLAATLCVVTVFAIYHLTTRHIGLLADSKGFNRVVMFVIPAAILNASFWQQRLRRTQGATWTLYAWSTGETVLLTVLILAGEGARSGLLPTYFLLVAISVLRCRPLLVVYVTALTMLSYILVWIRSVIICGQEVDPLIAIPRLLVLPLIGVIQFISLRQSSVSLETQADESLHRRSRNSK